MVHIILAAAAVCGCFVLFLVVVNLAATPRLSRAKTLAGPAPRVSVIVPARNEERAIGAAVGSQLAQDYPDFEVLVVNDRSTDRTGTIPEALARENPRLRIISGADPGPGWLGKPHAVWLGARESSGEILLFADADVRYHPHCLREAVGFLESRRVDFLALLRDGFGKNVAYLFQGFTGAVLLLLTVFWFAVNIVPPAVLLSALLGTQVSRLDFALAVWGTALPILARVVLAAALGDPLWPSFTHPIMAAVWAGITCRSLFQRIVLRRLTWRSREFDARGARF